MSYLVQFELIPKPFICFFIANKADGSQTGQRKQKSAAGLEMRPGELSRTEQESVETEE